MSQSITITRALVELKTVASRIDKALRDSVFVTYKVREKLSEQVTPNQFQKINDLIAFRKKLKSAIVQSNAVTKVKIGGEVYTVAEAIERKNSIALEQKLLDEMKRQLSVATNTVENHNANVQRKLDRLLEVEFGKDQVKSNVENVQAISESYLSSNRCSLVDPMDLASRIHVLEERIMEFEKEVDLALSESNAVTRISL